MIPTPFFFYSVLSFTRILVFNKLSRAVFPVVSRGTGSFALISANSNRVSRKPHFPQKIYIIAVFARNIIKKSRLADQNNN